MRLFPKRSSEERRADIADAMWGLAGFALVSALGIGVFFLGGELPPEGEGWWPTLRWIGLLIGALSLLGCFQGLLGVVVAATIGVERLMMIVLVAIAASAVTGWFAL